MNPSDPVTHFRGAKFTMALKTEAFVSQNKNHMIGGHSQGGTIEPISPKLKTESKPQRSPLSKPD